MYIINSLIEQWKGGARGVAGSSPHPIVPSFSGLISASDSLDSFNFI